MKVNGAMFRDALRRWGLRLESAVKQFDGSLHVFPSTSGDPGTPGAVIPTPLEVVAEMERAEDAIARLQVGQARYNLAVTVKVGRGDAGKVMTLTEAVKRVGGAGRVEKLWRTASMETPDPYGHGRIRTTDQVTAKRTIPVKDAVELAVKATGYAESLRAAINRGNNTEVELEGLEPADFE